MADWSLIRSTLATWVTTATGLPVYWRRQPRGWVSQDQGYCLLDISGRATVGNDEYLTEYDGAALPGSEMRAYQAGQRRFTLSVQVRTWRSDDDVDAMHYTSLIRDRICMHRSADAIFEVADIAFDRVAAETDLPDTQDGREMSVAQIDLRFNAASLTEDTATTWVEWLRDLELQRLDPPAAPTTVWTGDIEVF